MKRAIGERHEFAIDGECGERRGDDDRADDPAIDPALFDCVVLQLPHRPEPFRCRMRRELLPR